ncbi:MAG TPA: permease-like cell division protein FtsX [Thermaerobacter sp.]
MRFDTLAYFLREALAGIRRNGFMSFASASTVFVSLAVLSLLLVVAANVRHLAEYVEAQVAVVAFMDPRTPRAEAAALQARIEQLPGVAGTRFVTREQALSELKQMFGDQADLLEGVEKENPLRDSIEVRLADPRYADQVVKTLNTAEGVADVKYRRDLADRIRRVGEAVRLGSAAVVALLGTATLFLIANTIRLTVYARRREIQIMKLVGATDWFIRWPLLIEGVLLGLAGAAAAAVLTWWGYERLMVEIAHSLPFVPVVPEQPLLTQVSQVLLLGGALLGALGSTISLRRHLRV